MTSGAQDHVWVVLHWVDHGECEVDSVWSSEAKAKARVRELGRNAEFYVRSLDEWETT